MWLEEPFTTSQESKMGGWHEGALRVKEQQESKMEENKNDSIVKEAIVGVAPKLIQLGLVVAGIAFLISRVGKG